MLLTHIILNIPCALILKPGTCIQHKISSCNGHSTILHNSQKDAGDKNNFQNNEFEEKFAKIEIRHSEQDKIMLTKRPLLDNIVMFKQTKTPLSRQHCQAQTMLHLSRSTWNTCYRSSHDCVINRQDRRVQYYYHSSFKRMVLLWIF